MIASNNKKGCEIKYTFNQKKIGEAANKWKQKVDSGVLSLSTAFLVVGGRQRQRLWL
jgi:hypothetical protein